MINNGENLVSSISSLVVGRKVFLPTGNKPGKNPGIFPSWKKPANSACKTKDV